MPADSAALDRLYATILARKGADAAVSYSAKLMAQGVAKCAQKMGEEAVETIIAASRGERAALVQESADLLYHWLVVLAVMGVSPGEVYAALDARAGRSGLDEKNARKDGA